MELLHSILAVLAQIPWILRTVWEHQSAKSPLCIWCWIIWHKQRSHFISRATLKEFCPSCKIIRLVLETDFPSEVDSNWHVQTVDKADALRSMGDQSPENDLSKEGSCCLVFTLQNNWDESFWISYKEVTETKKPYADEQLEKSVPQIIPDQLDASKLVSWISKCKDHEESTGLEQRTTSRNSATYNIILVDVHEMRLVHCDLLPRNSGQRYLALSYVWGTANFFKTMTDNLEALMMPGGLENTSSPLPKTFTDAMRLVKLLGERYIWIDALCIVQDARMKHDQLNIMDQIYGRALVTIVLLAGSNVHSGLPGVDGGTRMRRQFRGKFAKGEFITGLPSLQKAIRSSTHFSRAWTFQETFLSPRCLFVSEGEVFFKCSHNYFAESLNRQARIAPGIAPGLALPAQWNAGEYEEVVQQYTKRSLSYDEDIVNAFMGALNEMEQKGYRRRGDITMDLPAPDSLLWFPVGSHISRRSVSKDKPDEYFPSWSWTGWKGRVTYASREFGRNVSTYKTSLRWFHRVSAVGAVHFTPLEEVERDYEVDFCKADECHGSSLFQKPEARPSGTVGESHQLFKRLQLYQFCAWVVPASQFKYFDKQNYTHTKHGTTIEVTLLQMHDADNMHCGALFNAPLSNLDTGSAESYSLVAMSMKKQWDWLDGITSSEYETRDNVENISSGCGCWLNVMLVKQTENYDQLVERVAVGQMHPRAFVQANPVLKAVTMI